ncbi:uncharacterized protein LOC111308148 [Durio zibethinus]|uniref:Uncharacterized protein LOC111308148 n=1 Tax=Durio zibethinus TaxID=66656 RepID=A0A6P6ABM9_DURZI|nr:uncharacterized protein LOC111308148 [Durio zibethinus]
MNPRQHVSLNIERACRSLEKSVQGVTGQGGAQKTKQFLEAIASARTTMEECFFGLYSWTIVSDRDRRFIDRLWIELVKLLGSDLNFSTNKHPQIDGQIECVNRLFEVYFKHYVSARQRDWPKLLDVVQFSYNLQKSEVTNQSLFEVVIGQQPLTPSSITIGYIGLNPTTYKFTKAWQEQADLARFCLHKATKRSKKWANQNRRDVQF